MKIRTTVIFLALSGLILAGCSNKKSDNSSSNTGNNNTQAIAARFKGKTLKQKAEYLINSNNMDQNKNNDFSPALYKQVVSQLKTKDDSASQHLLAQVYLRHGMYKLYNGPVKGNMHEAVTESLQDFINVLNMEPHNKKARAEINQILKIYKTMPNKSVAKELVPKLQKLGFQVQ
ncbi:MAG TPA: hypothetical protein VKA34_06845 [Balneolales bacterium]|nr:hypothetical protein [Balneolales bacterium]